MLQGPARPEFCKVSMAASVPCFLVPEQINSLPGEVLSENKNKHYEKHLVAQSKSI